MRRSCNTCVFVCECGAEFSLWKYYDEHVEACVSSDLQTFCSICGVWIASQAEYEAHVTGAVHRQRVQSMRRQLSDIVESDTLEIAETAVDDHSISGDETVDMIDAESDRLSDVEISGEDVGSVQIDMSDCDEEGFLDSGVDLDSDNFDEYLDAVEKSGTIVRTQHVYNTVSQGTVTAIHCFFDLRSQQC